MNLNFLSKALNIKIRRVLAICGIGLISINPTYAMTPFYDINSYYKITPNYHQQFFNFKENSIFNLYTKYDIIRKIISCSEFDEDALEISTIQKSYNTMRYYMDRELIIYFNLVVSKDIVSELIRYISDYPYDGTFWSVCEILHLTMECLMCTNKGCVNGLKSINFEDFSESKTTITFRRFKECMIDRLKKLISYM